MVRIGFKGPLAKSLGLRELEVEGGSLGEVLKRLSERLGVEITRKGNRIYMVIGDGRKVKFTVSVFHNGKNVITAGIDEIRGGTLEIITPMGGG